MRSMEGSISALSEFLQSFDDDSVLLLVRDLLRDRVAIQVRGTPGKSIQRSVFCIFQEPPRSKSRADFWVYTNECLRAISLDRVLPEHVAEKPSNNRCLEQKQMKLVGPPTGRRDFHRWREGRYLEGEVLIARMKKKWHS